MLVNRSGVLSVFTLNKKNKTFKALLIEKKIFENKKKKKF